MNAKFAAQKLANNVRIVMVRLEISIISAETQFIVSDVHMVDVEKTIKSKFNNCECGNLKCSTSKNCIKCFKLKCSLKEKKWVRSGAGSFGRKIIDTENNNKYIPIGVGITGRI